MSLKDILVFAETSEQIKQTLAFADALAQQHGASLKLSQLTIIPSIPMTFAGESYGDLYAQLSARALSEGQDQVKVIAAHLAGLKTPCAQHVTNILDSEAPLTLAEQARHADLTLMGWPSEPDAQAALTSLMEGVLFHSGRPLMLVPHKYNGATAPCTRIMLAWNAGREAARALHDALPLIEQAEQVLILLIDAQGQQDGHGEDPGTDIAAHLARHTPHVEVKNVSSMGRAIADVMLDEARYFGADLIVMGAYGHSRAREWIMGGATNDMLARTHLPVFFSH